MEKFLIFNADDFGGSTGLNRAIVDCHRRGVLTSASLMVTGRALAEAVALSRDMPELSVGLHFDVWGEDEREFNILNLPAVREEYLRQLDTFLRRMGRPPTHVDSHRHAHREEGVFEYFRELVAPLGVPLRGDDKVRFVGGFYAQWEWMVTNLDYVSVPSLQRMVREEVPPGWTEFSCHPGYVTDDYRAVYMTEREEEVRTLVDPRIKATIAEQGIRLVGYRDYNACHSAAIRR